MFCLGGKDHWGKIMNVKTSLVINSKNPSVQWLEQIFDTMRGFDEVVLYIDGADGEDVKALGIEFPKNVFLLFDGQNRDLKDGYNFAVSQARGEWVMIFCDDDYFIEGGIDALNKDMKAGKYDDADIVFFKVETGGGSWGITTDFSVDQIMSNNLIPSGSFIRKDVFEFLGGYKVNAFGDWNLWIRAKKTGFRFKYFDMVVYFFRQGHRCSFSDKCINEIGLEKIRNEVFQNA